MGLCLICMRTCVCVNCLTVYLSVRGENPKDHAVRQELVNRAHN